MLPAIVLLVCFADTPEKDLQVEAVRVVNDLTEKSGGWAKTASGEYFIAFPKTLIPANASTRIVFTLPKSGGGQVPMGAIMYGMKFKKREPVSKQWIGVADGDLVLTVQIPGSEGAATYVRKIASRQWRRATFEMPIGPGDDVATDAWGLIIENKTPQPIQCSPALMRVWLRYD